MMKLFLLFIIFGFLSFAACRKYCNQTWVNKFAHYEVTQNKKYYGNDSHRFLCYESVKIIDFSRIGIIPSRIKEVTCDGCLELKQSFMRMVDFAASPDWIKFPTAKKEVYLMKHIRYGCYSQCVVLVQNGCSIFK